MHHTPQYIIHFVIWFYVPIATFIMLVVFLSAAGSQNVSLNEHRVRGRFRVLYPDGQISQPFKFWTARDYAKMFGGKVILKNSRTPKCLRKLQSFKDQVDDAARQVRSSIARIEQAIKKAKERS